MKRISEYIDGYFDGSLSPEEETRLKVFLASPEGQASEYDEVRAVMGFFSAGRSLGKGKAKVGPRKGSLALRIMAAAAGLAIVMTLGLNVLDNNNVCVSFVGGKKVTDREVVMNDVDNILAELLSGRVDMEDQLSSIFGQ